MHDNNNVNDDFVMIISQPPFMHHSITLNDWNQSAHASSQRSIVSINHNNTIKNVNKTTLKHLPPSHRCHKEWEGCEWQLEALVHCMHLCIDTGSGREGSGRGEDCCCH